MIQQEPNHVKIIFGDGSSEGLLVTPMGENLYRLEESSILSGAVYHDIIEAELQTDGALLFLRVTTRSELKTSSHVLSKPQMESSELPVFLDRVVAAGGNWERLLEGFLILHLPLSEESLLLDEFDTWTRESSNQA